MRPWAAMTQGHTGGLVSKGFELDRQFFIIFPFGGGISTDPGMSEIQVSISS